MKRGHLILAVAPLLAGCAGSARTRDVTTVVVSETVSNIPEFYTNVPEDPNYLFAPATATSRDLQVAVNKAQAEGRNQIAQQLEVKWSGLTKRFQEEVGLAEDSELLDQYTQVYKAVVSQVLNGSRARQQDVQPEAGIYRAYVLMEMPIGEASMALMSRIKANEHMYTRFRAAEAFQELEEEVQRYEEWRRQQREREPIHR